MIPPELFQRLADLKERAGQHEGAALIEHAEARGMEEVLEAWQAEEAKSPVPQVATLEPRRERRDIRALVREEVFARPAGISPAEIRDRIGRVEQNRIEAALTYWSKRQAITWIDNLVCPRLKPHPSTL